jgi:hypothetical protein
MHHSGTRGQEGTGEACSVKRSLTLYHYTCSDAEPVIRREKVLRGQRHPFFPHLGPLLWLTSLTAARHYSPLLGSGRTFSREAILTSDHWLLPRTQQC